MHGQVVEVSYITQAAVDAKHKLVIATHTTQQVLVNSNSKGTTKEYLVDQFKYNKNKYNDTYICPAGQTLSTFGIWFNKIRDYKTTYQFKKYRTPACKSCPVKNLCTGRVKGGREIERSQYAAAVEPNTRNYKKHQQLYRTRQEINEHIFRTIKRAFNILKFGDLMQNLKKWRPNYRKV